MTLLSVTRAKRPPYEDVHFAGDERGVLVEAHREPAPVEAFYELNVEAAGERFTFCAEVRTGRNGASQLDWDDELNDLMSDQGMPSSALDTIGSAVLAMHVGDPLQLPLDLGTPQPRDT